MKKIALMLAIATTLLSNTATAAWDWYTRNGATRTIYVAFEQPVESVSVHIAGVDFGKCTAPHSRVNTMQFVPATSVENSAELKGEIGTKGLSATASIASRATSQTPALYKFSFSSLMSNVHYNIVYVRNGQEHSLGWRPNSNGGCTYNVS